MPCNACMYDAFVFIWTMTEICLKDFTFEFVSIYFYASHVFSKFLFLV